MVDKIIEFGATNVTHWDGRGNGVLRKKVPKKIDMVVILTDYVNHKLCKNIKIHCRKSDYSIVFQKDWSP